MRSSYVFDMLPFVSLLTLSSLGACFPFFQASSSLVVGFVSLPKFGLHLQFAGFIFSQNVVFITMHELSFPHFPFLLSLFGLAFPQAPFHTAERQKSETKVSKIQTFSLPFFHSGLSTLLNAEVGN